MPCAIQKIQRLQLGAIRHGQIEFMSIALGWSWSKTENSRWWWWCEKFFQTTEKLKVLHHTTICKNKNMRIKSLGKHFQKDLNRKSPL